MFGISKTNVFIQQSLPFNLNMNFTSLLNCSYVANINFQGNHKFESIWLDASMLHLRKALTCFITITMFCLSHYYFNWNIVEYLCKWLGRISYFIHLVLFIILGQVSKPFSELKIISGQRFSETCEWVVI